MGLCGSRPKSVTDDPIKSQKPEEKTANLDCVVNPGNESRVSPNPPKENLQILEISENSPQTEKIQTSQSGAKITMGTRGSTKGKLGPLFQNNATQSNKNEGQVGGFVQNRDIDEIEEMVLDDPTGKNNFVLPVKNSETQPKDAMFFSKPPAKYPSLGRRLSSKNS
jgi:hypothetical protein